MADHKAISCLKFLLILGVVLIHCDFGGSLDDVAIRCDASGMRVIDYISNGLMRACVPSFYMISGFLFFNNVTTLSWNVYADKLRRRVSTLLIPYLLWNSFCAILFLIKVYLLGFDGLSIIVDGKVDWLLFIKGFWSIDDASGRPFAFAFWFIRNLMVFVLLSPLVWILGRKILGVTVIVIIYLLSDINLLGFEWFFIGGASGLILHKIPDFRIGTKVCACMAFCVLPFVWGDLNDAVMVNIVKFVFILCGFIVFRSLANFLDRHVGRFTQSLINSTFFIYAFHQCFCSVTRSFWIKIYGIDSFAGVMAVYLSSFITLVGVSYIVYCMLLRYAPHLLNVVTGKRK